MNRAIEDAYALADYWPHRAHRIEGEAVALAELMQAFYETAAGLKLIAIDELLSRTRIAAQRRA